LRRPTLASCWAERAAFWIQRQGDQLIRTDGENAADQKNRFESRQIGMNVGDDKGAHLSTSVSFWRCVRFSKQSVMLLLRLRSAIWRSGPEPGE